MLLRTPISHAPPPPPPPPPPPLLTDDERVVGGMASSRVCRAQVKNAFTERFLDKRTEMRLFDGCVA